LEQKRLSLQAVKAPSLEPWSLTLESLKLTLLLKSEAGEANLGKEN
jgi:hypothetical protein